MPRVDFTIEICGMSGDGTIAAGSLLNEAMSKAGFSILAFDSYPAEIRGFGRCVTRSRIGDQAMLALSDHTEVLISLDRGASQLNTLDSGCPMRFRQVARDSKGLLTSFVRMDQKESLGFSISETSNPNSDPTRWRHKRTRDVLEIRQVRDQRVSPRLAAGDTRTTISAASLR